MDTLEEDLAQDLHLVWVPGAVLVLEEVSEDVERELVAQHRPEGLRVPFGDPLQLNAGVDHIRWILRYKIYLVDLFVSVYQIKIMDQIITIGDKFEQLLARAPRSLDFNV